MFGADPRGVRVEWRDGGGRTQLVRATELGRMMGDDPNLALSVLHGFGRWEAGRSARGMDPQRKGWVRVQDQAGETTSSSSSSSGSSGESTPPPKAAKPKPPPRPPRRNPATSSVARKSPPPEAQTKPKAKAKPKGKGKGKATPPPPNPKPPPPWRMGAGTPMGMCRVWGTPGMSLGRSGAMGGPSAK